MDHFVMGRFVMGRFVCESRISLCKDKNSVVTYFDELSMGFLLPLTIK
jgi:hypothetical protein